MQAEEDLQLDRLSPEDKQVSIKVSRGREGEEVRRVASPRVAPAKQEEERGRGQQVELAQAWGRP